MAAAAAAAAWEIDAADDAQLHGANCDCKECVLDKWLLSRTCVKCNGDIDDGGVLTARLCSDCMSADDYGGGDNDVCDTCGLATCPGADAWPDDYDYSKANSYVVPCLFNRSASRVHRTPVMKATAVRPAGR